jgi:hypothetical protein
MSLFENVCENYLEEMAAPRGAITIPSAEAISSAPKPEWINKFTESDINPQTGERRKPNARDGKYTGQDAWKALELFIKSGHGAGKTYPDNAKMQASIFDFLKHTAGWSASPAEKWMKTIGNYLYGLNLITQTPDETGNSPAGEVLPQASAEDIKEEEPSSENSPEAGEEPSAEEPAAEEQPESEETPKEPAAKESPESTEGAELDLSDIQQALLDLIESEGPLENNELVAKIDRSLIPRQYNDSDDTIKSYLRSLAAELGRKGLVKRTDDGWIAVPKAEYNGTLGELGDEEEQAKSVLDQLLGGAAPAVVVEQRENHGEEHHDEQLD